MKPSSNKKNFALLEILEISLPMLPVSLFQEMVINLARKAFKPLKEAKANPPNSGNQGSTFGNQGNNFNPKNFENRNLGKNTGVICQFCK